jgi:hypothetical protein
MDARWPVVVQQTTIFALANEALGMFASPEQLSLAVVLTAVRCHANVLAGNLSAALTDNEYVLTNLHQIAEEDAQTLTYEPSVWMKYLRVGF